MEWINLHLSTLRSEVFIGAEPVERATWLCLLGYCCGQENSGRIEACRDWKDRRWQQVAGVTRAEVMRESGLWKWESDSLVIAFYPLEQETNLRRRRATARTNGRSGGRPPARFTETDVGSHVGTDEEPTLVPTSEPAVNPDGKRKEREWNGIEYVNARASESLSAHLDPATADPDNWLQSPLGKQIEETVRLYPANGDSPSAMRMLFDHIVTTRRSDDDRLAYAREIHDRVTIHRSRFDALPLAEKRWVPSPERYFGSGMWLHNPNIKPWTIHADSPTTRPGRIAAPLAGGANAAAVASGEYELPIG